MFQLILIGLAAAALADERPYGPVYEDVRVHFLFSTHE